MGHYYAEMFPNGRDDRKFQIQWAEYQNACREEISEIIKNNPIRFDDINIGDKLKLYKPLNGISKIRLDKHCKETIRSRFSSSASLYGMGMWSLQFGNKFEVFDKRTLELHDGGSEKLFFNQVRIYNSGKPKLMPSFDWDWINIKYFEKI